MSHEFSQRKYGALLIRIAREKEIKFTIGVFRLSLEVNRVTQE